MKKFLKRYSTLLGLNIININNKELYLSICGKTDFIRKEYSTIPIFF